MKDNVSLPYPVLGINDDVYPLLKDDCVKISNPDITPTSYKFHIELTQENQAITDLIRNGKAEYICEVTCKNTFMRRCYRSNESCFEIELSRKDVNGRINLNCFVIVKQFIPKYKNADFNEDYSGFSFDMEVGDLLVQFPMAYYNTNVKYDKLYAAGSFMQIVEASEDKKSMWFNLNADRIYIELPHEIYQKYLRFGNNFPEIIHSSIVYNALVYALMNLNEDQYDGKVWSDSLKVRLSELGMEEEISDIMSVYEAADKLLQDPCSRLFDSLEQINDNSNE